MVEGRAPLGRVCRASFGEILVVDPSVQGTTEQVGRPSRPTASIAVRRFDRSRLGPAPDTSIPSASADLDWALALLSELSSAHTRSKAVDLGCGCLRGRQHRRSR
jgi:hypothetical protein